MDSPPRSKLALRILQWKENFARARPLLLSHHPNCPIYDSHVFHLGNRRLCIGCFVGYPVAILTIIILNLGIFFLNWDPISSLTLGIGLFLTVLLSFTQLTTKKNWKIAQKACMGAGAGMILTSVWYSNPTIIWLRIFETWLALLVLNIILVIMHSRSTRFECNSCSENIMGSECSGKRK